MKLLRAWELLILLMLLVSCTQDGDGSMSLNSNLSKFEGYGKYYKGSLDSGSRVHLAGESYSLRIDSLWVVSTCYIQGFLDSIEMTTDTVAHWSLQIPLKGSDDLSCPASLPTLDTLLNRNLSDDKLDLVILWNSARDFILDSMWVRKGSFQDSTIRIDLDSIDWESKNTQATGNGPFFIRGIRKMDTGLSYWWWIPQRCSKPRSDCPLVKDTIYPDSYVLNDTTSILLRERCEEDTTRIEYCASSYWITDTLQIAQLDSMQDTSWTYGDFYVEQLPHCSAVNREQGRYVTGNDASVVMWRELFIPSLNETRCGIPLQSNDWFVFDLVSGKIVADSALIDTILTQWMP